MHKSPAILKAALVCTIMQTAAVAYPDDLLSDGGTNPVVRVKVEMAEATSGVVAGAAAVAPAQHTETKSVAVAAVDFASATPAEVPALFAVALASATPAEVPAIFAAALTKALEADVPSLLSAALAKTTVAEYPALVAAVAASATDANVVAIAMEILAAFTNATAPTIPAAKLAEVKKQWFEILSAKGGSRAWWVLQKAKEEAFFGRPTDELKQIFFKTMLDWVEEKEPKTNPILSVRPKKP